MTASTSLPDYYASVCEDVRRIEREDPGIHRRDAIELAFGTSTLPPPPGLRGTHIEPGEIEQVWSRLEYEDEHTCARHGVFECDTCLGRDLAARDELVFDDQAREGRDR